MRIFVPMLVLFFINIARAQDTHEQVEYNSFGVPEQILKVIVPNQITVPKNDNKSVSFPKCSDPRLVEKIQNVLENDKANISNESIIQKRARILAAKNMAEFSSVEVAKFSPQTNRHVANMIISAKINQGLSDDDFAICEGNNSILKRRVFLLMQRDEAKIIVSVVNYRIGMTPTFVFD